MDQPAKSATAATQPSITAATTAPRHCRIPSPARIYIGVGAPYAVDIVFQRDEDGLILYVAAEVQLLSYKLVLLASVYLFFTQSTIADIIMNSLSLQFLLSLDNTVTSAVRHAPTVAKEMASWFDGYDWLSHRTTSYLVEEKKTGAFEVLGVRIRPFRLIPFIRYDLSIDRDWFKQHLSLIHI